MQNKKIKMKIILVRHGETEENIKRIVQGHLPGTLSKLGIEQAKKLAQKLKDEKIDLIYSSDLARALDTAKEIAKFHKNVPLIPTKELRERYLGHLRGKNPKLKIKKWDQKLAEKLKIETPKEIVIRAKNFIERLLNKDFGKNILIVAHNGINQAIITNLFGDSWETIKKIEKQKNASISIFEFDENKKSLLKVINDIKHLNKK